MDLTLYLIYAFLPLYALIISKGFKKPNKKTNKKPTKTNKNKK
jgi:hypothetical protein